MILLKNTTGRRSGTFVRYEYGQDLFGYLYLDVSRARKHRGERVRRQVFTNPRDFICALDIELDARESRNYVHADSAE